MKLLIYILGKSASGKDTIFNIISDRFNIKKLVIYTTRPIRVGEVDGVTYNFVDDKFIQEIPDNKIIEVRTYHTVLGDWKYFTLEDEQFFNNDVIIGIGTLESMNKLYEKFGKDKIMPIYIEVPDDVRLKRAMMRESLSNRPNYDEVARRFEADNIDFAEDKLKVLGIEKKYKNIDLDTCIDDICNDIRRKLGRIK